MGEEQPDRERNGQGRFSDRIPPDRVLAVFDERDDRARPLTANDITEAVGCARRTAHNKLNELVERGVLDTRKVGARGRVWWRPIPADEYGAESPPEPAETPGGSTPDTDISSEAPGTHAGEAASEAGDESAPGREGAAIQSAATTWDEENASADGPDGDKLVGVLKAYLEGRPPKTTHGRAAIVDVFTLLREHGTMKTGELKDELMARHGEHYSSKKALWESISRHLEDVPGIEKAGYGEWGYLGDERAREQLEDGG